MSPPPPPTPVYITQHPGPGRPGIQGVLPSNYEQYNTLQSFTNKNDNGMAMTTCMPQPYHQAQPLPPPQHTVYQEPM